MHRGGAYRNDSNNQDKKHLATELGPEEPLHAKNKDSPNKYGACDSTNSQSGSTYEISPCYQAGTETRFEKSNQLRHYQQHELPDGNSIGEPQTKLERLAARVPCLGIMLALGASIFLGSAGMLVKMTQSVHGIQVAVFRAIIQLLVYSTIIFVRKSPVIPERGERLPVLGRALLGSASITLSYYALKLIPLGDATTIRFSLPIWTLIIGYLLLGESCHFFKIFAVIISITGVVLIAKPSLIMSSLSYIMSELSLTAASSNTTTSSRISPPGVGIGETEVIICGDQGIRVEPIIEGDNGQLIGCMLALSSSICLSMSLIALRLCKRTPAEITIWWLSLWSIAIGSITLLSMGEWRLPNNWLDVLYIFLNGLCGTLGQWFITSALKVEQSGVIALARTCDIQVAFLYSAFLLHEQIRATSVVGSVMVSGGVVCCVIPKWLESRHEKSEETQKQTQTSQPGRDC